MSKTGVVLFLGAGFSKSVSSALPLGAELLKKLLAEVDNETQTVIKSLLPEGFSTTRETPCESTSAIQPFELLLAIVQRLRSHQLAGRPRLVGVDADRLWRKLVEGVVRVTRFEHSGYANWSAGDTEFSQFIAFLQEASRKASVSMVTTNYDLIADKAAICVTDEYLGYRNPPELPKDLRHFQYGYPIRGVTQSANGNFVFDQEYEPWQLVTGIPVYKLHGSTNWAYCDICKELDLSATRDDVQAVFSEAATCRLCESPYDWLLVPPVSNKSGMGHGVLERVWRAAEQALETASLVIFVGYSFPPADPVVLEMVTTAWLRSRQSHGKPWRYWIFNPDKSVRCRYGSIFGPPEVEKQEYFKMELLQDSWRCMR